MIGGTAAVARAGSTGHVGRQRLCADLAVLTTGLVVVGLFAISPVTLEYLGVSYITSGGGIGSKFHPSTFLAVLALVLRCLATPYPLRTSWRLLSGDTGVIVMIAATIVAGLFAALISRTPVTPLVDTFVLPVLCFLLLRDLDATIIKWFALLVACVLCVNAVMAIIEFLRGNHFLTLQFPFDASSDPTRSDTVFDWRVDIAQDWRAVALLGHPLVNGLIVGCFIICLAAPGSRWLPTWVTGALLLLQCGSMFAFGARASLILTLIFSGYFVLWQCVEMLRDGARLTPRTVAFGLFAIVLAIGTVEILVEIGFFDRTVDRFANDLGSAQTRSTMFELFRPLSWSDIILGPDQDVVATWQRINGLEFGIESSWVGLALTYGLLITSILIIGLLTFARSVVRVGGRGTFFVMAFYLISVSGTASMSGKVTSFAMAVVMVQLFLRRDERRLPLRAALGLEVAA